MRHLTLIAMTLLLAAGTAQGEWEIHVNSNHVTDVWADSENVYWASGFGAVIYDQATGAHEKLLKAKDGLASGDLTTLTRDNAGRLWLGTAQDGISVFRPNGTWLKFDTANLTLLSDGVADVATWDGRTVVGTLGGVSVFEDGEFRTFYDVTDWSGGDCAEARAVAVGNDRMLVGTDCGCYSYSFTTRAWETVISGHSTGSIDHDGKGLYWIVTSDSIYTYDGSTLTLMSKIFIKPDLIYDVSASDSIVWVAGSNGPAKYDFSTTYWFHFTEGLERSLWDARSVHAEDDGTVWIGTEVGAAVLEEGAWVIHASDGPAGNYVQDLEIDDQGKVWCATGTRGGVTGDVNIGIMIYDGSDWSLIQRQPLVSNGAYCIDVSPVDGQVYVGFWGQGLMRYDPGLDKWTNLTSHTESSVISDLYVDQEGRVFFGEYLVGMGLLCPDGTDVHYSSEDLPACIETECITAIGPGPHGAMVGSYLSPIQDCLDRIVDLDVGSDCLDKGDDNCEIWSSVQGYAQGNAYDFETDTYGVTWLSGSGGLSALADRWRTVNTTFGEVWDVEVDKFGDKWVAATEGLYVLKGFGSQWADFSETYVKYDASNSPLDDSPVKALSFDADGALWIGTGGGGIFKLTLPREEPVKQWVDVFPNPYYAWEDRDGKGIRFLGFMPGSVISIFTVAGDLVAEIEPTKSWYGKNTDGKEVVSGVYIYRAYAEDGREFVGKLVIVR
jgi:ligand-binding sensor domain-containing protein